LTEKVKIFWVYALTALFLVVNFYLVLEKDIYWFFILPVALIVLYFYLVSLDRVLLFITFLTPLAVNISNLEMGLGISLPTEPLMFGVLLVFLANLIFENKYDRKASQHPISYLIYIALLWMLLTTFTSEFPIVSFKYLLSRLWFVVPFYFLAILVFKSMKNIKLFMWLYISALLLVIFYTISMHAQYGFEEDAGHWVMSPFYNDHTAYGAALAIFYPVIIGFIFFPGATRRTRIISFVIFLIMTAGIILSYGRAAWISVAVAAGVFLVVLLRIRFYWIALVAGLLIGIFFTFQQQILDRLEKNKQDSSANFIEHVQSIYNISSDASNLERINRWQAALRMFNDRPILGWGPGTYQFVYAPYQRSREKTIISTNLGDKGNAHSEYLGPLSEMGIPGMLIVILLLIFVIYYGLRVYKRGNIEVKFLSLMVTLGLITYFSHGILNNFLDTDKLSVPFWGFIAVIVALDIYHLDHPPKDQSGELPES
jgi:putative inorganic carbon (hco3(-)) transporter